MRILLSGASGLIGRSTSGALARNGHDVVPLVREIGRDGIRWDPRSGDFDAAAAEGADAVVHLAGENVASGRWTAERKREIRDSRVRGTRLLAEGLVGLARPPSVLVAASAIGIYGDRGDEIVDEASAVGTGFLADVCREWEAAAGPAVEAGIRVVHVRFGVVLDRSGGALAKMLPIFRLGLGGKVGSGSQWMSWIAIEDAIGILRHALETDLSGPLNAVAPEPVRNTDFTRTLGNVLARPAAIPVPAFALRLAFGEMADATLLASTRAVPSRLLESGYRFRAPTIGAGLSAALR
jgi:uncharacterized protein